MRVNAGVASADITPPDGLEMAGFAARREGAQGRHDGLSARALVIGDTGLVALDVLGVDSAMAARIRKRAELPTSQIVVAATHTHSGPVSMTERLTVAPDPDWLAALEDAAVETLNHAKAASRPARLSHGAGQAPVWVARNRRHVGGPVDLTLPVMTVQGEDGAWIAVLASAALHPVVLGADNLLWTADYPHFLRQALEEAFPGALAVFVTGCTGDVNTGHTPQDSLKTDANPKRTFAEAEKIGRLFAGAALAAPLTPVAEGPMRACAADLSLPLQRSETEKPEALAAWRRERKQAAPERALLLDHWIRWAETFAQKEICPTPSRVSLIEWGGVKLIAFPGEIFAATALDLRAELGPADFVISYAEDNPGYIPPESEYQFGGYEMEEAHRYYGMPAAFAPGAAEALAAAARNLLRAQA